MKAILRKRLRTVATFVAVTTVAGGVLGIAVGKIDGATASEGPLLGVIIGASLGGIIAIFEVFVIPRFYLMVSHFALNSLRFFTYVFAIIIWLTLGNAIFIVVSEGWTITAAATRYVFDESFPRDVVLASLVTIAAITVIQVRRLHNPGEIIGLLTGKFHYPEQQQRIVLFADLVNSTSVAERLSPVMSSKFIRDFFSDISEAILAWGGQVYQYLGDGVIITWPLKNGKDDVRSLNCYFEMSRILSKRRAHYQSAYGEVPHIRAGIHAGPVVATWVGEAKRELALHGDVLYVSARVQSLCKEYDADCLVSDHLFKSLVLPPRMVAEELGEVALRGRESGVRLHSVYERNEV